MTVDFKATGKKRKALVETIEEITGLKAVYKKTPNFEYVVGGFTIDRNGVISSDDEEALTELADKLKDNEEEVKKQEEAAEMTESFREEPDNTPFEIPFKNVNVGNLMKLLDAKENLIKKALGIDDISIEMKEDRVAFPWFSNLNEYQVKAYKDFITALCRMSKQVKNVRATERTFDNEKYSFRCFLLRLGFIGDEYKMDRKILLMNLTGSTAFRNGGASHEITE